MSIITRQALTYETFREITSTAEYTVPATNLSDAKRLTTTNYLILADGNRYLSDDNNYYTYYYDKASGIKTGGGAGAELLRRSVSGTLQVARQVRGRRRFCGFRQKRREGRPDAGGASGIRPLRVAQLCPVHLVSQQQR